MTANVKPENGPRPERKLMSKFILPLLFLVLAIAATSCAKKTKAAERTEAEKYSVQTLFTYENCTVYKFADLGLWHYGSTCGGVTD